MATAKKLPSGNYRIRVPYKNQAGEWKYKSFTHANKKIAERMALEFSADLEKQEHLDKTFTFQKALDQYISERSSVLSPASIRKYKQMQGQFQELDYLPLCDITSNILQNYINTLSKDNSPKTVKDKISLVKAAIYRFIPNQKFNLTLPKKKRTEYHIPTDDIVKKILEEVKDTEMELPVMLASMCMMRRSEISALSKDDLSGNRIHIHNAMVYDDSNRWIVKEPKTYAGNRYVTAPDIVCEKINALPPNHVMLNPQEITNRHDRLLARLKIPHFRFHEFRHYSASKRHALGIPDAYIMEEGGWENANVLVEIYRHVLEDEREKNAKKATDFFNNL